MKENKSAMIFQTALDICKNLKLKKEENQFLP